MADKVIKKGIINILVAVIALLILLSPLVADDYLLGVLITILTSAYLAQCWNLMSGYAGQFSFGHAAFFGLGAYTSSLLYVDFGISPILGMFAGAAVAAVVGLIIGFLSFRYKLKGDYFALATLAFAEILRVLFNNTPALKAAVGITIPYVDNWKVFQFGDRKIYFYTAFVMVAGITYFLYRMQKTKMGLYFIAIRENEDAGNALGIDTFKYKLIALTLSAVLTALAGTFYAQYYLFIDPSIVFNSTISVGAIAPCIIGGVGTILGPVLGAFILTPISELTNTYFASFSGMNMVIYGAILISVIIFLPNGVMGIFNKNKSKRKLNLNIKLKSNLKQIQ